MLFASPITSNCLQTFSTKTEFQIDEVYTTISNHDNNARTPTHCNNRNLESNDISIQTAPRRRSSYPTSMRSACGIERADRSFPVRFAGKNGQGRHKHRCVRLTALSELTNRFPFDSRARMDKADTNGYNESPHTLRCKRSLQGFTTEPIACPVEETPDEFPIKARSSSYEQRNPIYPIYPIRNADRCRRARSHPPNRTNTTNIRPVLPAPIFRRTRQPPCAAAVLEPENRHDPISQHEQSLDSVRARPDKRALGALLAAFTGHHTMHGGDTGVPESRFILSHFLSDDSPKQTYVACIVRFPASTRQTRRTPDGRPSYLLSRDRYPIPDYRNASLMSS